MNSIEQTNEEQLKLRSETADRIIKNVDNFAVCEGCESIVSTQTIICPICNAYRFNRNKKDIIARAKVLSKTVRTSPSAVDYGEDEDDD